MTSASVGSNRPIPPEKISLLANQLFASKTAVNVRLLSVGLGLPLFKTAAPSTTAGIGMILSKRNSVSKGYCTQYSAWIG
jgi:hypothetical protein